MFHWLLLPFPRIFARLLNLSVATTTNKHYKYLFYTMLCECSMSTRAYGILYMFILYVWLHSIAHSATYSKTREKHYSHLLQTDWLSANSINFYTFLSFFLSFSIFNAAVHLLLQLCLCYFKTSYSFEKWHKTFKFCWIADNFYDYQFGKVVKQFKYKTISLLNEIFLKA